MSKVIPMERSPLPVHETLPTGIRTQAQALGALSGRVVRILNSNAALPDMKRQAKEDLVVLARDALELWGGL